MPFTIQIINQSFRQYAREYKTVGSYGNDLAYGVRVAHFWHIIQNLIKMFTLDDEDQWIETAETGASRLNTTGDHNNANIDGSQNTASNNRAAKSNRSNKEGQRAPINLQ